MRRQHLPQRVRLEHGDVHSSGAQRLDEGMRDRRLAGRRQPRNPDSEGGAHKTPAPHSQYSFTDEGSNRGSSRTVRTKVSSFVRTSGSRFGYQSGLATTRPRNAKNGPATSSSSRSPVAFR